MTDVEFVCPHCDQRFRASASRIGHPLRCRSCQRVVHVPTLEAAAVQMAERQSRRHRSEFQEFRVRDDNESVDDAWEFDPGLTSLAGGVGRVGRRWFVASGLLAAGLVAWMAFRVGFRWGGWHLGESQTGFRAGLWTCSGRVELVSSRRRKRRKSVATGPLLVVAWPQWSQLEERIPSAVMASDARETSEQRSAIRAVELIGGAVAWCDSQGTFALRLLAEGPFELLVVCDDQGSESQPSRKDLARIGRLFVPAYDLVARHVYHLETTRLRRERPVTVRVEIE